MKIWVDLQWFADEDVAVDVAVPPLEFEDEEPEIEIVDEGSEGVLEEEEEGKSKEDLQKEIESLRGQADTAGALKSAVEQLGDKLAPQQVKQVEQEVKKKLRDDPEFAKKFNEDIFKDDPFGTMYPVIEKLIQEQVGQIAGQVAAGTADTKKQLLGMDPDKGVTFKKYKGEIETFVSNLEPQYRNNPNVWEYAYEQVRVKHMDEIVADMVDVKVKEALGDKGKVGDPQFSERSGGGSLGKAAKSKKVTVTRREEALCNNRGLPVKEYARMKAEGASYNEGGELVYG